MATYVCSDIHGCYKHFLELLETINFQDTDKMYILGDVIDRSGNGGIDILRDIMKRDNIELILGNHEYMMLNALDDIVRLKEGLHYSSSENVLLWIDYNGGRSTYKTFKNLPLTEQNTIKKYLRKCPLIKIIEVNGKKYHLSHSFTIPTLKQEEYLLKDVTNNQAFNIVWKSLFRKDIDLHVGQSAYNGDYTYIIGHVPTDRVVYSEEPTILRRQNVIDIDCGCVYGNSTSALACLCLEDDKEFYIVR